MRDLEWYFGDDNYTHDGRLHTEADNEGWVMIENIAKWERMVQKGYPEDFSLYCRAVQASSIVQLNKERNAIRRKPQLNRQISNGLRRQIEWYLLDEQWVGTDTAEIVHKMVDQDGWVPLEGLMRQFKDMQDISRYPPFIYKSIQESTRFREPWNVEYDAECKKVRRLFIHPKVKTVIREAAEQIFTRLHPPAKSDAVQWTDVDYLLSLPEMQRKQAELHWALGKRKFKELFLASIKYSRVVELNPASTHVGPRKPLDIEALEETKRRVIRDGTGKVQSEPLDGFKVLSYNILADFLCMDVWFPWTTEETRRWKKGRREKIVDDIRRLNSDLICIQEVQRDHYKDYLEGQLESLGYTTYYTMKTAKWKMKQRHKNDIGNLIGWKAERWKKLDTGTIKLVEIFRRCESCALRKRYGLAQVAPWALLQFANSNHRVLLCSTHICADWKNHDVQLMQTSFLLEQLHMTLRGPAKGAALVLAGDFNSTPNTLVYKLIAEGAVPPESPCLQLKGFYESVPYQHPRHDLKLGSAYHTAMGKEPEFTNYVQGSDNNPDHFHDCLDYVFFSEEKIECLGVLSPLKESAVQMEFALPNTVFPSDHIPIQALLQFKPHAQIPPKCSEQVAQTLREAGSEDVQALGMAFSDFFGNHDIFKNMSLRPVTLTYSPSVSKLVQDISHCLPPNAWKIRQSEAQILLIMSSDYQVKDWAHFLTSSFSSVGR